MNSPPDADFYIDENLDGQAFVGVLLSSGVRVIRCRDLGFGGTEDAAWIPEVSKMGLVIVTADVRTRYRPVEKQALIAAQARVIHLKLGSRATHAELALNFVSTLKDIERFINRSPAPWLVTLSRPPVTRLGGAVQRGKLNRVELR